MLKRVLTLMGISLAIVTYSQPGSIDPGFGNAGLVTTAFNSSQSQPRAMIQQADGKIIAAGYLVSTNGTGHNFAIARYNTNGSADNTFNGNGQITTSISTKNDWVNSLALQADGKLLAAGYSNQSGIDAGNLCIARYNVDGTLDMSFNGTGILTTASVSIIGEAKSVLVQPDQKIVIAGQVVTFPNGNYERDFIVMRFNTDGTPDLTFNQTGFVVTSVRDFYDEAKDALLQPDGKILVAGNTGNTITRDNVLIRYNTDGSLDNSFDGDGVRIGDYPFDVEINSITLLPSGKIMAGGSVFDGSSLLYMLSQYNLDGSPDLSFNVTGFVTTGFLAQAAVIQDVVARPDGKIIAAGWCRLNNETDVAIAQYNPNGTLDIGFDQDGKVTTPLSGYDMAYAAQLAGTRLILAVVNGNDNFSLVGYQSGFTPLPVHLNTFTASRRNTDVLLEWTTLQEENTDHFEVMRSRSGNQYDRIGYVNAAGNSTGERKYSLIDRYPETGTTYYQLRTIDKDGKISYSKTVVIKTTSVSGILLFPNPVKDMLQVQIKQSLLSVDEKGWAFIKIQDQQGRVISQQSIPLTGIQTSTSIDVSSLAKGIYYLVIQTGIDSETRKFVHQ